MPQAPKVILLADDDLDDQELLEEAILQLEPSAEVHTVMSGRQVVEYLQQCNGGDLPCLIILDYNMPEASGAEVLQLLCNDARYLNIPKVIWSTSNAPAHIQDCLDKGASWYFVKPAKLSQLTSLAEKMLALCGATA